MRARAWTTWPGSHPARIAGNEYLTDTESLHESGIRALLSTHSSLVKSSAARSEPPSGSRTAKLSPGLSPNSRPAPASNLTFAFGLSHFKMTVPDLAAPLFQNLARSFTGWPAVAQAAPVISKP